LGLLPCIGALLVAGGFASAEPLSLTVASPVSREAFADFTEAHVADRVDIRINGEVLMSPFVVEPIRDGVIRTSRVDRVELALIAKRLSGAARMEVEAHPD
jgi:hypothetical protein